MAIFSLHHAPIGKSTQARRHTAAAHIRYITRRRACTRVLAERMPGKSAQAHAWISQQEDCDRANARVLDKVLLALPRELTGNQRAALVRAFAEEATLGKAPWLAAFHDQGEDLHNPHVHLVIRDRDPESGRRVCGMSERGSTERLRELWERYANQALENAGRSERIDRRSLAAQGLKRRATIHEGLSARDMEERRIAVRSRTRDRRNAPGARTKTRAVNYAKLDQGRSRPQYNRQIRETIADYWEAIDAEALERSRQVTTDRTSREYWLSRMRNDSGRDLGPER